MPSAGFRDTRKRLFSVRPRRGFLRSWAGSKSLALWRAAFPPYYESASGGENDTLPQMRKARNPDSARDARP